MKCKKSVLRTVVIASLSALAVLAAVACAVLYFVKKNRKDEEPEEVFDCTFEEQLEFPETEYTAEAAENMVDAEADFAAGEGTDA